jgi:phosphoribosylamine--glycine ligase
LKSDGIEYTGFIFIGIIKVNDEPFVIEYNCRLGDPETEVVIPRLKNDLVDLFAATANKKLNQVKLEEDPRVACTVMAVSAGYPATYEKGFPISGLDFKVPGTMIFHAGTSVKDGQIVTNGGRVFCITAFGETIDEAVQSANDVMGEIDFEGMYFRNDIGWEFR